MEVFLFCIPPLPAVHRKVREVFPYLHEPPDLIRPGVLRRRIAYTEFVEVLSSKFEMDLCFSMPFLLLWLVAARSLTTRWLSRSMACLSHSFRLPVLKRIAHIHSDLMRELGVY